jgi:hypothetical protein
MKTATELAQKIADQELEACCEWLGDVHVVWNGDEEAHPGAYLRADRRPKPPSLKKQALKAITMSGGADGIRFTRDSAELDIIRRALEQLPD